MEFLQGADEAVQASLTHFLFTELKLRLVQARKNASEVDLFVTQAMRKQPIPTVEISERVLGLVRVLEEAQGFYKTQQEFSKIKDQLNLGELDKLVTSLKNFAESKNTAEWKALAAETQLKIRHAAENVEFAANEGAGGCLGICGY